jgi:hypothetical protein
MIGPLAIIINVKTKQPAIHAAMVALL